MLLNRTLEGKKKHVLLKQAARRRNRMCHCDFLCNHGPGTMGIPYVVSPRKRAIGTDTVAIPRIIKCSNILAKQRQDKFFRLELFIWGL